jgi:hypothetical protein
VGCDRRWLGGVGLQIWREWPTSTARASPSSIGAAEQVLVFEGAEESLDRAVGLRALDAGADVAQERVLAGERFGEDCAVKAWCVVEDDGDGRGDGAQQLAGGLIDQVDVSAVGPAGRSV